MHQCISSPSLFFITSMYVTIIFQSKKKHEPLKYGQKITILIFLFFFFMRLSLTKLASRDFLLQRLSEINISLLNLSLNYLLIQKKDSCKFVIALRAIRLYARDAWQYGRWKMMKDASWSSSRQSICRHLRAQVRVSQLLLHGSKIIVVAKI